MDSDNLLGCLIPPKTWRAVLVNGPVSKKNASSTSNVWTSCMLRFSSTKVRWPYICCRLLVLLPKKSSILPQQAFLWNKYSIFFYKSGKKVIFKLIQHFHYQHVVPPRYLLNFLNTQKKAQVQSSLISGLPIQANAKKALLLKKKKKKAMGPWFELDFTQMTRRKS